MTPNLFSSNLDELENKSQKKVGVDIPVHPVAPALARIPS